MSDYKAVKTEVELTEEALVTEALGVMGIQVEKNVVAKQRWEHHNRKVDICIRQGNLPANLQGFGDVGFVKRGNAYEPLGCSEQDSAYMDRDKRREMMSGGMSKQQAEAAQPDGKFTQDLMGLFKKVENGYAILKTKRDIKRVAPSAQFARATGKKGDDMAWMVRGELSASDLKRLGIQVPA